MIIILYFGISDPFKMYEDDTEKSEINQSTRGVVTK